MRDDYLDCRAASNSLGEDKDCAVVAVTCACYQEYDFVRRLFIESGRQPRCGTPFCITKKVLSLLGRKLKTIETKAKTVRTFEREADPKSIYLVRTSGHILCVRDGRVCDWTRERRHRIIRAYKVVSK